MIQDNKHNQIFKAFAANTPEDLLKNQPIQQLGAASSSVDEKKRKKERLNPDAQHAILEIATLNEIQNKVAYGNAFIFRSFRIKPLEMEDAE